MALLLAVDESSFTLSGLSVPPGKCRPLAPDALRTIADTYAAARRHANEGALLRLGEALWSAS